MSRTLYSRYTGFEFAPEDRDRVLAFWAETGVASASRQPGFVAATILESAETEHRLRTLTLWQSKAAFDAYYASDEHQEMGRAIKGSGLKVTERDGLNALHFFGPSAGLLRVSKARVADGRADAVAEFWRREGAALLRRQDGCIRADGYFDDGRRHFVTVIEWQSAAHADRFVAGPEHAAFAQGMKVGVEEVVERMSLEKAG